MLNPTKYFPARGQLRVGFNSALKGLEEHMGKPYDRIFQKVQENGCPICGSKIDPTHLVGDHIIPLSMGGERTQTNRLPMCKHCNVKKGRMHFFDFWYAKLHKKLTDMDPDVLVHVIRAYWKYYKDKGLLFAKPPLSLIVAFKDAERILSTDEKLKKTWDINVKKLMNDVTLKRADLIKKR